jgi:hypothetical protein
MLMLLLLHAAAAAVSIRFHSQCQVRVVDDFSGGCSILVDRHRRWIVRQSMCSIAVPRLGNYRSTGVLWKYDCSAVTTSGHPGRLIHIH